MSITDLSAAMWATLLFTALLGSCSQFSMTVGMQHEKSARAALMRMSDVLGGFLWQSLFTQDPLSVYTVAGTGGRGGTCVASWLAGWLPGWLAGWLADS
jgi:drug/metabolite transporter (DMT)-like permease